jgi:hypothetical protein
LVIGHAQQIFLGLASATLLEEAPMLAAVLLLAYVAVTSRTSSLTYGEEDACEGTAPGWASLSVRRVVARGGDVV